MVARRPGTSGAEIALLVGWLALAAVTSALVPIPCARAADPPTRVLRGVTVTPAGEWTIVDIHLDLEFRYLSHSPGSRGRTLQIRMRPEPSAAAQGLSGSEVVEWRERDVVGLIDVELDADSAGHPQLVVHFDRVMAFEVSQGRDLERIRVRVRSPGSARRRSAPTPADRAGATANPDIDSDKLDEIMDEGRKAMTAGDYGRAVLLFTKALQGGHHPRAAEAKELLGLAHQRSGQRAHARAEYEDYLALYGEADGADRVRQRLQALLTLEDGRQPRAARPRPAAAGFAHSFSGSLSQFYRSNVLDTEETGAETTNSSLDSDLFATSRHTRPGLSLRTNWSASYRHDLLSEGDASDALRITSAFLDVKWREGQQTLRLGRQSAAGGGVLGRFDGFVAGARVSDRWTLNLVSGFPVDFVESNHINSDRPFYGLRADSGTFWSHWDAQVFAIQQWIEGIEDRTAVGGQLRFVHSRGFGLALVDYDGSYSELNTAMFIGNWRVTDATSLNALVDVRASPIMTTFNAIQGQPVGSIDELRDLVGKSQIRQLAEDRTTLSRLVTLGVAHQLNRMWQVSGDVTVSNLSSTDASPAMGSLPAIDAMEGTGNEYFYTLRTSATNLLLEGSYTTFDVRYADTATGKRYSVGMGGRYPVIERLRIGPQLVVELRRNDTGEDQWRTRPSVRVDYRWRRFLLLAEGGVDISDGSANAIGGDENDYFFTLGYRYDF